jgi:hypothetical protein
MPVRPCIRNYLLYPVMALLAALGLMLGPGSSGGASTAGASQAPGAAAARAAISSLKLFKIGHHVAAGDSITASVVRSGSTYTLKVTDSTHPANSFSTNQGCSSCANSSAEWIAEAPSGSSGIYPLADFGSWTESGATVTEGSTSGVISSFTDDEITMIDSSGLVKAQPGALKGSGNGFSVTWERSN